MMSFKKWLPRTLLGGLFFALGAFMTITTAGPQGLGRTTEIFQEEIQEIPERISSLFQNSTYLGSCFSKLRTECMRHNCLSRTLVESQDPKICEHLEAEQKKHGIEVSDPNFISQQDCRYRFDVLNSHHRAIAYYGVNRLSEMACPIRYGTLSAAMATISPETVEAGHEVTIKYRWQGGPSELELEAHTLFEGSGQDEKGWYKTFFSDDFMPPISTLKWLKETEFTRTIQLPTDLKAGTYVVQASLRHPTTKAPAELMASLDRTGSQFSIGTLHVKDPARFKPFAGEAPGSSALEQAAYEGNIAKIQTLLKRATKDDLNRALYFATGASPVVNQVYRGSTEAVRVLVEHGADVNSAGKTGVTPLMTAVTHKNIPSLEYLLAHGAQVNAKDQYGMTALQIAVHRSSAEGARLLLEHGADSESKDGNGKTPLEMAVLQNDLVMTEILKQAHDRKK
jgi:hypothetical protein